MRLVEDDTRVLIPDVKVLTDLLVYQVVVGHENNVGAGDTVLVGEVGADQSTLADLVQFLNVQRVPSHGLLGLLSILVVSTGVETSLGFLAGHVQHETFEQADLWVDAEVVTRTDYQGSWVIGCVDQLFLDLGQLGVGS